MYFCEVFNLFPRILFKLVGSVCFKFCPAWEGCSSSLVFPIPEERKNKMFSSTQETLLGSQFLVKAEGHVVGYLQVIVITCLVWLDFAAQNAALNFLNIVELPILKKMTPLMIWLQIRLLTVWVNSPPSPAP